MPQIEIHYHRPPARLDVFVQQLVVDGPDCKITLHEHTPLRESLHIGESHVYEPGAPLIWFVFPGAWHDVGRFHLCDGTFTGYYVNLITPVEISGSVWTMYDLCLDLWVGPDGSFSVLDRDEFDEAVDRKWIDTATAKRAESELERVIGEVEAKRWPPVIVASHDLETVRELASVGC
jgi:predicted RNA-binding protein associated with RNAse of E/G family